MPSFRPRARRAALPALVLAAFFSAPLAAAAPDALPDRDPAGRQIALFAAGHEAALRAQSAQIWDRDEGYVISGVTASALDRLDAAGIAPLFSAPDRGEGIYILSHVESFVPLQIPGIRRFVINPTSVLYLVPAGVQMDMPNLKFRAMLHGIPRIPIPEAKPHAADAAGPAEAPQAPNPLVQQILNATSQASWFNFVREVSGDLPVDIPGTTPACTVAGNCRVLTRYSNAMFPAPNLNGKAFGTEYLLNKGAGWGYSGVLEPFTAVESGCTGQPTWKNVIFTIPGQVDWGQHQQVLFVTHHDTVSYNATENQNYAPGADDAMSGGSALLEAMKVFKDYGFANTLKIIYFSGEELITGMCGSYAYTRMHPVADMWRVVNMDQTAYDGNRDKIMNLFNWDAANCPSCVAFGDVYVQANQDYGQPIAPANLFRQPGMMCQTDHCPFWKVGVTAIDLNESFSEIHPCFDSGQTATCHDDVVTMDPNHPTQLLFDQNYSWPTEKIAIATVATVAGPLYACPAAGAVLGGSASPNQVQLTWPGVAPVTNYLIERADGGCGGTFSGIASVTSGAYTDNAVTNGLTYGYRIRTCPTQVSNCVSLIPNGPSANVQAGSAVITADSGDGDLTPDNCELVTARVNLVNDGNMPLTNVRLGALSSTHPGVQIAAGVPQSVGSLTVGATAQASFKFYLGRNGNSAACAAPLNFTATASSNESAVSSRSFSFTAERDVIPGPLSYGFETDFSGWTVNAGVFTRVAGGAPGSTAFSLHSRSPVINNDCNSMLSPVVTPTASSVMTMYVNYAIETGNFDRAVVRAVNLATGVKTLLTPTGAIYNTAGSASGLCDGIGSLQGWSGTFASWRQASFNLAAYAGIPIQIEVRFSTDSTSIPAQGFWMDLVTITNATQLGCDTQSNACAALPAEVSPAALPVKFTIGKSSGNNTLRFSESAGATSYHVYGGTLASLRTGVYNHGALTGLCGLTDAAPGDGQVTATTAAANLPDNSYFLAVAKGPAGESPYGYDSAAAVLPVALNGCP
jgi:hypothetical protein